MSKIDTEDLKRKVKRLAEKLGQKTVQMKLIQEGLSFSLAYQLSKGEYVSDPKERVVDAIERVLKCE